MPDEITELIEAVQAWRFAHPTHYPSITRLNNAFEDAEAAGYPARREAERRVIEAARWFATQHQRIDGIGTDCPCCVCESVRALDAATPKEPTDAA